MGINKGFVFVETEEQAQSLLEHMKNAGVADESAYYTERANESEVEMETNVAGNWVVVFPQEPSQVKKEYESWWNKRGK
jgi:hypothetical protein